MINTLLCSFEPTETTYTLTHATVGTGSISALDTITPPATGTTSCRLAVPANVTPASASVKIDFTPFPNFTSYSTLFFRLRADSANVEQALNGANSATFFKIEINNSDLSDSLYSINIPSSTTPLGYSLRTGIWENVSIPFPRISNVGAEGNPSNTIQYVKFTIQTCPADLAINIDDIRVQGGF